jgi:membrane protease YdiL (CAAX protease family)
MANDEDQQWGFTLGQGLGIFALLLVANVIVGGLSSMLLGLHATIIISELIILLVAASFLHAAGCPLSSFFSDPRRLKLVFWIWLMVASISLYLVVSDVTGYVNQLFPRPKMQQEALLRLFVAKTWPEYLFRLFGAAALAGFSEEFAFRGFLQSIFVKRLGGVKGLVLTALLFALTHLDPWNFAGVFLLGLFLGYIAYLTGNLWVPIFVHFFSNSIAFSIGFFSPDVGVDFGYTSPPFVTLLFTFLFIVSLGFVQRAHRKAEQAKALSE